MGTETCGEYGREVQAGGTNVSCQCSEGIKDRTLNGITIRVRKEKKSKDRAPKQYTDWEEAVTWIKPLTQIQVNNNNSLL